MNYSTFDHNCTTYISSLTTESSANSKFVQIDLTVAIIFSVFDGVGIALGTLANLVMVFMVLTQSDLHSTTDIFTASLCISDLLASILFQPLVMRRLLARRSNPAFEWGLRRFVGQMTLAASSISLVTATIDRYIVLKKPSRHANLVSKPTALAVVAMVWLASLAIGLTAYLKREIAAFLFLIVISCIVATIFVFQILIFCIARAQVKKIWKQTCPLQRRHQTSYLKHMKATTTIILLLTAFLVSWLPSTIFRFHDRITGGDLQTFHKWLHVLNTFIQIHCCLDPYLYVFRNQRFKSVITRYLKRRSDRQVVFTASQASVYNVSIQLDIIGQGGVVE